MGLLLIYLAAFIFQRMKFWAILLSGNMEQNSLLSDTDEQYLHF